MSIYWFLIGNFTRSWVDLYSNELVVFEEGVFKEMLQQMVSVQPTIGGVNIAYSKFFNTLIYLNIIKYFIDIF